MDPSMHPQCCRGLQRRRFPPEYHRIRGVPASSEEAGGCYEGIRVSYDCTRGIMGWHSRQADGPLSRNKLTRFRRVCLVASRSSPLALESSHLRISLESEAASDQPRFEVHIIETQSRTSVRPRLDLDRAGKRTARHPDRRG
jgi:hypothetical protein